MEATKFIRKKIHKLWSKKDAKTTTENYHKWYYYNSIWQTTRFLGIKTMKSVSDMWNYQEVIFDLKPALIIEFGTNRGGAAVFFSQIMSRLNPEGRILTVEIDPSIVDPSVKNYDNIELVVNSSVSDEVREKLKDLAERHKGPIFAILDSDHSKNHVLTEMKFLREFMKKGDYLVVEDCNVNGHPILPGWGEGPHEAVDEYFRLFPDDYTRDTEREKKFGFTFATDGFLIRN